MTKGYQRGIARGRPQKQGIIKQNIKLNNFNLTVDGATGIGFGTAIIGDFPEGNILFLGALTNLTFDAPASGIIATWDGNFSIGTAPTADSTLSAGEVDIIPSTVIPAATATIAGPVRATHAVAVTGTVYDNTDNSLEINLNVLVADLSISANGVVLAISGDVTLSYIMMLDD